MKEKEILTTVLLDLPFRGLRRVLQRGHRSSASKEQG
jgi:hypothetical protein